MLSLPTSPQGSGGSVVGGTVVVVVVAGATVLDTGDPGEGATVVVAGAGDVNGDGYDDIVVGAPGGDEDTPLQGTVYVYQGSSQGLSTGSPDWTTTSEQTRDLFGSAVGAVFAAFSFAAAAFSLPMLANRDVDVVTAALAISPLLFVHVPQPERTEAEAQAARPSMVADLREVFLGDWEGGEFRKRVADGDPIAQLMYVEQRWDVIPGGEPAHQFENRVRRGIERIAGEHPDQLVVVHGGPVEDEIIQGRIVDLDANRGPAVLRRAETGPEESIA